MDDKELCQRILKFISGKSKKTESTAKIVQALRVPKKSLNIQLYKLQKSGQLIKVQETPPVWSLSGVSLSQPAAEVSALPSGSSSSDSRRNDRPCVDEELVRKTYTYLCERKKPVKSLEIAKAVGYSRVRDINPTLYHLQEKGVVQKGAGKSPTWKVCRHDADDLELFQVTAGPGENLADNHQTVGANLDIQQSPFGGATPVFQDTELFNTDLSFEDDPSDLYPPDNEEPDETESLEGSEPDVENEENEDEIGEEVGMEQEDGVIDGVTYSPMTNEKTEVNEKELKEESVSDNEYVSEDNSLPDAVVKTKNCLEMETGELNKLESKPKTFRQMFNLDDPITDEESNQSLPEPVQDEMPNLCNSNEQNVDVNVHGGDEMPQTINNGLLEAEEERKTPELAVLKEEKTTPDANTSSGNTFSTPNIINDVLDMETEEVVSENNCEGEFLQVGGIIENDNREEMVVEKNNFKLENLTDNKGDLETEVMESENGTKKDVCNAVADMKNMTQNETEIAVNPSGQASCDMEASHQVLKVLSGFPGITQFVLKNRTKFSNEKLEEVMSHCESLGYVTGSSRLWKITTKGDAYIKDKSSSVNNDIPTEKSISPEPVPKKKTKYAGPPPPPMAIIKGKVDNVSVYLPSNSVTSNSTNSLSGNNMAQSSPALLFSSNRNNQSGSYSGRPTPLAQQEPARVNKLSQNFSAGPKPLMSVTFPSKISNTSSVANSETKTSEVKSSSSVTAFKRPMFPSQIVHGQRSAAPNSQEPTSQTDNNSSLLRTQGNLFSRSTSEHSRTGAMFESGQNRTEFPSNFQNNSEVFKRNQSDSNFRSNSPVINNRVSNHGNQSNLNSGLWDMSSQSSGDYQSSTLQTKMMNKVTAPPNSLFTSTKSSPAKNNQSKRSGGTVPPPTQLVIPSHYADYPNQTQKMSKLSNKTPKQIEITQKNMQDPAKRAFNKGPPPSPLAILTKNLKKTEISPSKPEKPIQTVYQQSTAVSSQTHTSTFSKPVPPRQMLGIQSNDNYSSNQSQHNVSGTQFQGYTKTGNQFNSGYQTGSQQPVPLMSVQAQPKPVNTSFSSQSLALSTESFAALNKNPVSALMEYAQNRKLVAKVEMIGQKGSAHRPTFEMAAFVGDRKFPSIFCHNKKDGRAEACDIAMRQAIAEGQFQCTSNSQVNKPAAPLENMTHFDKVAALTHRGFTALVSQITTESFAGRKVIAGLVMKRSDSDTGVLVSLGTGNRCITGPQLSLQGNTVNDSHAEIITRRGFIRFLYKQLLEYNPSKPNPMFEKSPNGKLQIKSNITFHLYISTAPCGDGALFSPRDVEAAKAPVDQRVRPPHNPTFTSNVQGLLRTKVEGGEGTIPVEPGFKCQTFDGIQRGERLRTMSCTDKICRWNVVGMQGALLSHFLEPVYLDSLCLGLLYDHGHLSRAVCCRVGKGVSDIDEHLPPGYKLNHPWLGRVTVCDPPREVQKTKALSVNWCFGDKGAEVTDGTMGLCYTNIEKSFFSRCTKNNLYGSFKSVCEKFGRSDLLDLATYKDAKMMAGDFQAAREAMLSKFKENNYGKWVSKPVEEEMFTFDVSQGK